jgi:hypothetical protein
MSSAPRGAVTPSAADGADADEEGTTAMRPPECVVRAPS